MRRSSSWAPRPRCKGGRSDATTSGGCSLPDRRTCSSRSSRWSFPPAPAPRPSGTVNGCGGCARSPRHRTIPRRTRLARLLDGRMGKTLVFVQPRASVYHLVRRLRGHRVAAVTGERGWFGSDPAPRQEVLRAFAPRAQGASRPAPALETNVLIASDLLSEGLNLQDAVRVIHYDLPWSPARLAQRVGRIDRLGSPHGAIETVTFLPPAPLAEALRLEERLAAKTRMQSSVASAHLETIAGPEAAAGLDWCDRLDSLAQRRSAVASHGSCSAVAGAAPAVVLIVRIGGVAGALLAGRGGARPHSTGGPPQLQLTP